jgi:small subunit ribosomal protein S3
MESVMHAGALGVEIRMSGKIPSSRAKSWRFYQGYLKKCGDSALTEISVSYAAANLKSGTIGVQVRIMPPEAGLSDKITLKTEAEQASEQQVKDHKAEEVLKEAALEKAKKPRKKASKKAPKEKTEEVKSEGNDGSSQ